MSLDDAIQRATEDKQRQYVRLRTLLPLKVVGHKSADAASRVEYITDLSENGIFVRTLTPHPVNAVLPVNIIINSLPIKLKAVVVRSVNIGLGLFKNPPWRCS